MGHTHKGGYFSVVNMGKSEKLLLFQVRRPIYNFSDWAYRYFQFAFCSPSIFYKDKEKRLLSNSNLGPSENILSHMTAKGMAARLGAESKPSQALNQRHILYNQHARSQTLKTSNLNILEQYNINQQVRILNT